MDAVEFGTLYERYSGDVLRFALSLTGQRAEAEDIASETFVRAWTATGEIRAGTVKAYLFLIARNLAREKRRKHGPTAEIDERVVDPGPGPDQVADQQARFREVLRAMQTLSEPDRVALAMRAQSDLSYEWIANALGTTVAAARVRVHRARLKLEQLLSWRIADEDHA
jgi:RNA polymerase sigma-70 factor (ECF subfamily)